MKNSIIEFNIRWKNNLVPKSIPEKYIILHMDLMLSIFIDIFC